MLEERAMTGTAIPIGRGDGEDELLEKGSVVMSGLAAVKGCSGCSGWLMGVDEKVSSVL
jgi:hypothetical protein